MEKVLITFWIIWFCFAIIQSAYQFGRILIFLAAICVIVSPPCIIWVFNSSNLGINQQWPLTIFESLVVLFSILIRPVWYFKGLNRAARALSYLSKERQLHHTSVILHEEWWAKSEIAHSRLLFGTGTLFPRMLSVLPVFLILFLRQGWIFTIICLLIYLSLLFFWFLTATGSWYWMFRFFSYGDSGYGDMPLFFNFIFLTGETILPSLVLLTFITHPIHSYLYRMIILFQK